MSKNLFPSNLAGFSGIADNSKNVKKGFVFVAMRGIKSDGHNYINEAIKNGATLIVGEKDINLAGTKYLKVKDSREFLGKLASNWYGNPSKKLKIIGVTGTKGKTTTTHLIYHILSTLGKKVGLVSSNMVKIGAKGSDTGFHVTSPDVISLHKLLKEMVDKGCQYAVIEVSSHGIDQKRIAGINFEVGVLTNIAPEHLDYHKTFEEYKKVKMFFVNSAKFKIIAPIDTEINILPGKFNNLNVDAAIKAVEFLGIEKAKALSALESFELPEGRLEKIENKLGLNVYVDFAHTPESLEAALIYLKSVSKGRVISVFGSAGERDPYKRPKMGKAAGDLSDIVILTAEDPRTEKVEDIMNQIKSGIINKMVKVYQVADRKLAIKKAVELAQSGDTIGLFGKGHEKSMNLDGIHEIPWSDQEIVKSFLEEV